MHYGNKIHRLFYYNSPLIFKNLIATFYGYIQRKKRFTDNYKTQLNFLKESQFYSNEKLKSYQWEQTKEFYNEVIAIIPFYKYNDIYNIITRLNDQNSLRSLPILSKEEVRKHIDKLYYPDLKKLSYRWTHTSGTTGKALIFPLTEKCFQREYAFRALHYLWGGINLERGDRIAFCSGHPVAEPNRKKTPFWVYDYANNQLFFSSYHLSEDNLKFYIKELEIFKPKMLSGYPSSVYLLAQAYKKYGSGTLKPKAIYTASETLLEYQRKIIEDVFQCKVFVWYGNSEMCCNIVECEYGELHLKLEHSYVEILDSNNYPVGPGEKGRLICTGFGNIAFPLIRYDIGDEVVLASDQISKCGRGGIIIEKIIGRIEDYIVTPDGRFVGRLDHLFKDSLNVREAQLIQNSVNELIIRIVCREGYSKKDEMLIEKEARLRLGDEIKLVFDYVDQIERSANGKFRFVISNLKHGLANEVSSNN
ncbi:MAG: hypothetical protein ONB37_11190 [candidate division KSB1 bacterium]|nr:hypothetical protein [candidate division KSB1 bacterium]